MKKIEAHNVEDCLEILAGISLYNIKFNLHNSDSTLLTSIARQVKKNVALTDKQYSLVKTKLVSYQTQFENYGINLDYAIEKLRLPLRSINRDKTISICEHPENVVVPNYLQGNFIKIRFPFSKNLIVKIETLSKDKKLNFFHTKGSHEHYVYMTEKSIHDVVQAFQNDKFDIDEELIERFTKISKIMQDNPLDYLPHYNNGKFYNLSKSAETYLQDKNFNLIHLQDRKKRYGIHSVLPQIELSGLINNIVYRKEIITHVNPEEHAISDVFSVLNELQRYPLLVTLDTAKAYDQIEQIFSATKFMVDTAEQTVLVREDTKESKFNNFIHENKINNRLTDSTKIVYIFKDNLPKLLLKENWFPCAVFSPSSGRITQRVYYFIQEYADLIIYYDNENYSIRNIFANAL